MNEACVATTGVVECGSPETLLDGLGLRHALRVVEGGVEVAKRGLLVAWGCHVGESRLAWGANVFRGGGWWRRS